LKLTILGDVTDVGGQGEWEELKGNIRAATE